MFICSNFAYGSVIVLLYISIRSNNFFYLQIICVLIMSYVNFDIKQFSNKDSDPHVYVVADYGDAGDLAFLEVASRINLSMPKSQVKFVPVCPFNTIETGFVLAQLALHAGGNAMFLVNTAPREDDLMPRQDNAGESSILAVVRHNGALVLGVNSGHSFSYLKDYADFYQLNLPDSGTQFRSRDVWPIALSCLAKGQSSVILSNIEESLRSSVARIWNGSFTNDLIAGNLDKNVIPEPLKDIAVYIDGYGNIKSDLNREFLDKNIGKAATVYINEISSNVLITNGSFDVHQGSFSLSRGSSGWEVPRIGTKVFSEVFERGGSASEYFDSVMPGDKIHVVLRKDMEKVKDKLLSSYSIVVPSDNLIVSAMVDNDIINGTDSGKLNNLLSNDELFNSFSNSLLK